MSDGPIDISSVPVWGAVKIKLSSMTAVTFTGIRNQFDIDVLVVEREIVVWLQVQLRFEVECFVKQKLPTTTRGNEAEAQVACRKW